jgi:hypothetical protein
MALRLPLFGFARIFVSFNNVATVIVNADKSPNPAATTGPAFASGLDRNIHPEHFRPAA